RAAVAEPGGNRLCGSKVRCRGICRAPLSTQAHQTRWQQPESPALNFVVFDRAASDFSTKPSEGSRCHLPFHIHRRRTASCDGYDSRPETGGHGRSQWQRGYHRHRRQPNMAGLSGEGTQSCLGFAAPKNPHQGITAIAAGFWKMLPVMMYMRLAMEISY